MKKLWKPAALAAGLLLLTAVVFHERAGAPATERWTNPETTEPASPTMLELGTESCPPCRRMLGELVSLRARCGKRLNLRYCDLDLPENRELERKYAPKAVPMQVFLAPDGRDLYRHVGFFPADRIVAKWRKLGYEVETPSPAGR